MAWTLVVVLGLYCIFIDSVWRKRLKGTPKYEHYFCTVDDEDEFLSSILFAVTSDLRLTHPISYTGLYNTKSIPHCRVMLLTRNIENGDWYSPCNGITNHKLRELGKYCKV